MRMMLPIPGFEGKYSVGILGAVYSHLSGKYLRPEVMRDGYLRYTLIDWNGEKVRRQAHIFLAEAYLSPKGEEVNHKNHIRDDNTVWNIEWVTTQRNIEHGKSRWFVITHPDGAVEEVFNLSKFCREHDLHLGAMHEMATGRERLGRRPRTHHKGFRCAYHDTKQEAGEW
ncbi:hypothetical protein EXT67_21465 [Pectobacterium atrosepticum]|uniref:Uncharacterized protein n=1 Tax=Pectobacterium phage phiTE TaxID=1116482 RepID=K9L4B6_9CAUD|nr:HNH endonuclease [Pectobacterium atrosepticum]YP_007392599.1 hypothetical protein phiTE_137 [Pectobacterium phage phiTE]AEZ66303.1 hypothetical protein phiTE_137 [Pectobacterium phage phiTE]ARB11633.1 putative HNH endonuclease [Pectobacterium phage vB_PatM_CB7]MCL6318859.1 hypothetical protein [Pectobacterium atrosepticum]